MGRNVRQLQNWCNRLCRLTTSYKHNKLSYNYNNVRAIPYVCYVSLRSLQCSMRRLYCSNTTFQNGAAPQRRRFLAVSHLGGARFFFDNYIKMRRYIYSHNDRPSGQMTARQGKKKEGQSLLFSQNKRPLLTRFYPAWRLSGCSGPVWCLARSTTWPTQICRLQSADTLCRERSLACLCQAGNPA